MAEHIIPQIEPLFGREERRAVYDYMCGGAWLTEHSKTAKLEAMIASYLDVNHCIMVPNCTLALYASMMALGIGPGDEVIVPAFTMIATAHAVGMTGAKVVFCDVDPETWCIEKRSVEQVMSPFTKAIIQVDLNGRCINWDAWVFCGANGLHLIEDAAQAFGSWYEGIPLGTFSDAGCFSLSPHKIISTGQGGFITTDSTDLAGRIRSFKSYGRIPATQHNYVHFGSNLKFTDLQAVIGIEQMKKLDQRIRRKREIMRRYKRWLPHLPDDNGQYTPWYIYTCTAYRDKMMKYLANHGIATQRFYPAVHKTKAYSDYNHLSFPNAETLSKVGLWLPSSPTLTNEDIDYVGGKVKEFYDEVEI